MSQGDIVREQLDAIIDARLQIEALRRDVRVLTVAVLLSGNDWTDPTVARAVEMMERIAARSDLGPTT